MMNINNRSWEKLRATDIVKFLSDIEESIFVEFKSDDEAPNKLVKEISAFANTYILIDRRWFNEIKEKYTQNSLIQELFYSEYTDLGYIDPLTVDS